MNTGVESLSIHVCSCLSPLVRGPSLLSLCYPFSGNNPTVFFQEDTFPPSLILLDGVIPSSIFETGLA